MENSCTRRGCFSRREYSQSLSRLQTFPIYSYPLHNFVYLSREFGGRFISPGSRKRSATIFFFSFFFRFVTIRHFLNSSRNFPDARSLWQDRGFPVTPLDSWISWGSFIVDFTLKTDFVDFSSLFERELVRLIFAPRSVLTLHMAEGLGMTKIMKQNSRLILKSNFVRHGKIVVRRNSRKCTFSGISFLCRERGENARHYRTG